MRRSAEDEFLAKLAGGEKISQDEYDQMCADLPLELVAEALARRFRWTEDMHTLVEAARLYQRAGRPYEALEICSRFPKVYALRQLAQKILPRVRADYQEIYPQTVLVGKLLDEAFLVIDLASGSVIRFPPLMPSTL